MRQLSLLCVIALALSLGACSSSKNKNPVGSGDEVGSVADSFEDEKPATYTAKEGDTLRKIAGRPEIYGDPNLWPILQEANSDKLGQGTRVNKGTVLDIPRDITQDQIDEAREKARQAAAASKMGDRPKSRPKADSEVSFAEDKKKAEVEAADKPTPVPAQPVPKAKKGGMLMPILLVLLLILAALAFVLFRFMKKDSQDEPKE